MHVQQHAIIGCHITRLCGPSHDVVSITDAPHLQQCCPRLLSQVSIRHNGCIPSRHLLPSQQSKAHTTLHSQPQGLIHIKILRQEDPYIAAELRDAFVCKQSFNEACTKCTDGKRHTRGISCDHLEGTPARALNRIVVACRGNKVWISFTNIHRKRMCFRVKPKRNACLTRCRVLWHLNRVESVQWPSRPITILAIGIIKPNCFSMSIQYAQASHRRECNTQ
mmetsp:Transcript_6150/g.14698  ORF Transcript_6150/g.14698 Transcript_6150/m.14698 type:complete len:222 (+) Transcript_6150:1340-2005(+)